MKVVVAPKQYKLKTDDIKVFLGGGITGCENWQEETINELRALVDCSPDISNKVVVFNPRRENFPEKNAAKQQIKWEFNALEMCDVFSMYFSAKQIQPICLYELGRNLLNMKMRFPTTYLSRICISCPQEYERSNDVQIQTSLALFGNVDDFTIEKYCYLNQQLSPITHAQMIANCILALVLKIEPKIPTTK